VEIPGAALFKIANGKQRSGEGGTLSKGNTICPMAYKRDGGRSGTLNVRDFECKCYIIAQRIFLDDGKILL
jgi:hypothetical protein